jgi:ribose/xylose/arabinose/galactoside ABC-type transport system permease subunit
VTLGGLLTFAGIAYVLTSNRSIPYPNFDVAMLVNDPIVEILSLRSVVTLAGFVLAALVIAYTRVGRDVIAMGSDRRASMIAGVNVDRLMIGVFTVSGALAALSGVLVSYSLAAASPIGLADVLVPGTAAAIIGGISLSGGRGRPMGILVGVLVLCVLRSGLNALGASPHVHEIATGAVLLTVAILDGPALVRRVTEWRLRFKGERAGVHG